MSTSTVKASEGDALGDLLQSENRKLRQRVETLEKQNRDLRRSVYDLSVQIQVQFAANLKSHQRGHHHRTPDTENPPAVFDLEAARARADTSVPKTPVKAALAAAQRQISAAGATPIKAPQTPISRKISTSPGGSDPGLKEDSGERISEPGAPKSGYDYDNDPDLYFKQIY